MQQPDTCLTTSAVIFDMDGVIIDSGQVIEKAWSEAAARRGIVITEQEAQRSIHGRTGAQTVEILFPDHTPEQRLAIWREVDMAEEEAAYEAIAGVQSFLHALHDNGAVLALVTSGWPRKIEKALDSLGLGHLFALRLTRDDTTRGKPHPEPYLTACRELGIQPAQGLVFEDSLSGVRSAVSAGTACVGVGAPDLLALGAIAVVPDFTGLSVTRTATDLVLGGLASEVRVTTPGSACRD
ncbi:HAD family phosphatase [Streptomyces sp. NPDC006458]|uniref:HAD family hydrolase n=1 Tax=Streptomyces sp. NPDC006458 TaxID=3154302 RepID=UPI0033A48CBE